MSSLIGRQIVVTRAIEQAAALSEAIGEAGGSVVALPLLEIVDVEDGGLALREAIATLTPDDWLVVLSPNGASRVVDLVRPNPCSLAVIASGTAKVLEDAGWTVHLRPDTASSEGLLSAFDSIDVSGRVLIAQAKVGRPVLADGLRERGLDVSVVAAYHNVLPEVSETSVALARAADTVVFASPSAVDRYVEHVGDEPRRAICIGGVTAARALASGFDVTIAPEPTVPAIIELLNSP
ncbi:MAG: uroporphyrinogen-III synthase [Verrucomicrobiales bacterium]|jgi:uroporphyrinogen-III synthase